MEVGVFTHNRQNRWYVAMAYIRSLKTTDLEDPTKYFRGILRLLAATPPPTRTNALSDDKNRLARALNIGSSADDKTHLLSSLKVPPCGVVGFFERCQACLMRTSPRDLCHF